MIVVVADTSPINYLILLGYSDLLQELYGEIAVPSAVIRELAHPAAQAVVRAWAAHTPKWAKISDPAKIVRFGQGS